MNECHDGCGGHTKGGKYLPGHDAKHVSHLTNAVKTGAISHQEAHDSIAHSPKLQNKLASKLGGVPKPTTPATASHPAPGELPVLTYDPSSGEYFDGDGNQVSESGVLPYEDEQAVIDELTGTAPKKPASGNTNEVTTGTTGNGRKYSFVLTPDGVGSILTIAADMTTREPEQYRNRAIIARYLGDGKVELKYKDDSGHMVEIPGGPQTFQQLRSRAKVYQFIATTMDPAHQADKAKKQAVEVPKVQVSPPGSGPAPMEPWKNGTQSHTKLHKALTSEDLPGYPGTAGNSEAHKRHVASRVATQMKSTPAEAIAAAFMDSTTDTQQRKQFLDAAKHPDAYWKITGYGGHFTLMKKSDGTKPSDATQLTGQDLKEYAVRHLVAVWAGTSNDSSVESLTAQEAAIQEFGLENTSSWNMQPELKSKVDKALAQHGPAVRDFLRAQYDLTQADMKKRGITHVNLYRGMRWDGPYDAPQWTKGVKSGNKIDTPALRPLSSWTVNTGTANSFASAGTSRVVLKSSVPASAVLSWPRSGYGVHSEYEFVVLGGVGQVTVSSASGL